MKLSKATIYYFDTNNEQPYGNREELEILFDRSDMSLKIADYKEVEIGEWYDEIPLNYSDCKIEQYEYYFDEANKEQIKLKRIKELQDEIERIKDEK